MSNKIIDSKCFLVNNNIMVVADSISSAVKVFEEYKRNTYGTEPRVYEVKQMFSGRFDEDCDTTETTLVDGALFDEEECQPSDNLKKE